MLNWTNDKKLEMHIIIKLKITTFIKYRNYPTRHKILAYNTIYSLKPNIALR